MTNKSFAFGFSEDLLPLWHLYGQRALEQKLALIKSPPYLERDINGAGELTFKIKALSKINLSQTFLKPAIIIQLSVTPTKQTLTRKIKIIANGAVLGLIAGIVLAFLSNTLDLLRASLKSVTLT